MPVPNTQLFIDLAGKAQVNGTIDNLGIPINPQTNGQAGLFRGDYVILDLFFLQAAQTLTPTYECQRFPDATVKTALGLFGEPEAGFFTIVAPARTLAITSIVAGVASTAAPHGLAFGMPFHFSALVGASSGSGGDPIPLTDTPYWVLDTRSLTTFTFYNGVHSDSDGGTVQNGGNADSGTAEILELRTSPPYGTLDLGGGELLDVPFWAKGLTAQATAVEVMYSLRNVPLPFPRPLVDIFNGIATLYGFPGEHETIVTGNMKSGFSLQLPGSVGNEGSNFPQLEGDPANLFPPCNAINETLTEGDGAGTREVQLIRFEIKPALESDFTEEIVPDTTVTVSTPVEGNGTSVHEVQRIAFASFRAGGYLTITFAEGTTAPISYDYGAAQITAIINDLLGPGKVVASAITPLALDLTWKDFVNHTQVTVDSSHLIWLYGWRGALDLSDEGVQQLMSSTNRTLKLEVELTPDGADGPTTVYQGDVQVSRDLIR